MAPQANEPEELHQPEHRVAAWRVAGRNTGTGRFLGHGRTRLIHMTDPLAGVTVTPEMAELAAKVREAYLAFIQAGFSEDLAVRLVGHILNAAWGSLV